MHETIQEQNKKHKKPDIIARIGGDEFGVFMEVDAKEYTTQQSVDAFFGRLRANMEKHETIAKIQQHQDLVARGIKIGMTV